MRDNNEVFIVKRVRRKKHKAHGGAWKIAYADFVTAMMAFFLLMWLLGSTTKGQLKGVSDYFKSPFQVALSGGDGSGNATSIIKGGGNDIRRDAGQSSPDSPQVRNPQKDPILSERQLDRAKNILEKREQIAMEEVKSEMLRRMSFSPNLSGLSDRLKVEITSEGLLIQIVDKNDVPMFPTGSSDPAPFVTDLLNLISESIDKIPNKIVVGGHTDAKPYQRGVAERGNWELSSERANAARRAMAKAGIPDERIERVTGYAAKIPLIAEDPFDPLNRRISILVLAESKKIQESGTVEKNTNP